LDKENHTKVFIISAKIIIKGIMKSEIDKIKRIVDNIDGWLADVEGEFLYNAARNCTGKGVIVEIGSWKGKSTIWLGKGSKAGNKVEVYAIDPHTGSSEHQKEGPVWTFEEFKINIKNAKIDDIVVPIVKTSADAAKNFKKPVELIFIDGAHEYEMVKLDFELWFPKLVEGGFIAFHDTCWGQEPARVVKEFVFTSRNFRNIGIVGSITFAQKVKQNSIKDMIRNRYLLLLKMFRDFLGLYLPEPIKLAVKKIISPKKSKK